MVSIRSVYIKIDLPDIRTVLKSNFSEFLDKINSLCLRYKHILNFLSKDLSSFLKIGYSYHLKEIKCNRTPKFLNKNNNFVSPTYSYNLKFLPQDLSRFLKISNLWRQGGLGSKKHVDLI